MEGGEGLPGILRFLWAHRETWGYILVFVSGTLLPVWFPLIKQLRHRPLSVRFWPTFGGRRAFRTFRLSKGGSWTSVQVELVGYLRITNTDDKPLEISDYVLEARHRWKWYVLPSALRLASSELGAPLIIESTLGALSGGYIDFTSDTFDSAAHRAVLERGHSVRGWAFFRLPTDAPAAAMIRRFRLTVVDTLGRKTVVEQTQLREQPYASSIDIPALKTVAEGWKPIWSLPEAHHDPEEA